MSDYQPPPFPGAVDKFKAFLSQQGRRTDLMWICRGDVVELWPHTYVRLPAFGNEPLMEQHYHKGIDRGLGIRLQVFCFLADRPCCYVWLPKDEKDASYAMLPGLSFNVPSPLTVESWLQ